MKATTVKIPGELLAQIEAAKPDDQSVSAFVRGVLLKAIQAERNKRAAEQYRSFVDEHDDERQWLEEWDTADLVSPPGGAS